MQYGSERSFRCRDVRVCYDRVSTCIPLLSRRRIMVEACAENPNAVRPNNSACPWFYLDIAFCAVVVAAWFWWLNQHADLRTALLLAFSVISVPLCFKLFLPCALRDFAYQFCRLVAAKKLELISPNL
ncbi:MAG: hypothetical protein JWP89_6471 [Schlesneria sp.]|nr:hypothetical protein [Schlesneria sp.]